MRNDSTVFVALDVHQKSIVAAYAVDAAEVEDLGGIGVRAHSGHGGHFNRR